MTWVEASAAFRNVGLVVVAAVGVWLAWRRAVAADTQSAAALRQSDIAQRQHVAELFNRSVEQLSSDRFEVRLGAVYTLREINADYPEATRYIIELIAAHLRMKARDTGGDDSDEDVADDVRAMMEIARRGLEE